MGNKSHDSGFTKGLIVGSLVGGLAGAITALLLAPKSGKELREDLAYKSGELYDKATDFISGISEDVGESVGNSVNEGRQKAQRIVDTAKKQAENLLVNADKIMQDAKAKATAARDAVAEKYDTLKEATKAGVETFKKEIS